MHGGQLLSFLLLDLEWSSLLLVFDDAVQSVQGVKVDERIATGTSKFLLISNESSQTKKKKK